MTNDHYLTLIQRARHTAETLCAMRGNLPADLVERQARNARRNLEAGKAKRLALGPDPLRRTDATCDMTARAETALTTLGF